MKKYLFSFISIKTLFFILLSFLVLHPDIVFATIHPDDTTYYFSERGKLLWCDVHATKTATYVVKTRKTHDDIFNDISQDDSVQLSADYSTAAVKTIPRRTARKVGKLLRHGAVDNPLVMDNIVPMVDKRIMRCMYDNILFRCTTEDAHNKEHGGVVFPDGTVTCITGDLSDPRWLAGAALLIKEKAMVYYHSHPDGTVERQLTGTSIILYR